MKKLTGVIAGLCILSGCMAAAAAQEMTGPPQVLVIQREYLKPGRAGTVHEKSESAFVRAMAAAKWPTHYFAADSLSGRSRSLFFVGYPSFQAWEKDNQDTDKNAVLSAALDHAALADGDLLTEYDSNVFAYRPDLSFQAPASIATLRYFEISSFHARPGHTKEFEELAKIYVDNFKKVDPDAHWAIFQSVYGTDNGGMFIVISPMKSLAEIDKGMANDKKFAEALGEDGMKKLAELAEKCIASEQSNLFRFNPKMSYPPDSWIKEDPGFWKPKAAVAAAPAKQATEKSGQ